MEDVGSRPDWQTATLARIDAAVTADAGARRLARILVAGLECDDAPTSFTRADSTGAVEVTWKGRGRTTCLYVKSSDAYIVSAWDIGGSHTPFVAKRGDRHFGAGWAALRTAVAWAAHREFPRRWGEA